jgi:hypothetical protein
MNEETYKLPNGMRVLARWHMLTLRPVTYANRTQAYAELARLGDGWFVWRGLGRPWFVARRGAA